MILDWSISPILIRVDYQWLFEKRFELFNFILTLVIIFKKLTNHYLLLLGELFYLYFIALSFLGALQLNFFIHFLLVWTIIDSINYLYITLLIKRKLSIYSNIFLFTQMMTLIFELNLLLVDEFFNFIRGKAQFHFLILILILIRTIIFDILTILSFFYFRIFGLLDFAVQGINLIRLLQFCVIELLDVMILFIA